uniref:Uncharacterized protein n=1 Tax=Rhipicephalus appendiculatus TaxID=34631 RepID=A0A131YYQ9_RHIAP
MSLLRWETVFFLSDEVFHVARAASDLGVLLDACFHGIPSMAAMVRVMSSLFLLAFHTLYLGPRSSLASDAAIFFGDMQFHFFHMLLGTWQLVHYLWTTQKRQARTYVYYWTSFIFHTGIVWFYTSGITVSVRVQLVHAPGDNAPVAVPPPIPAAPDPEAVAMAIAAARAADAAAARLASRRRSSASSPRGSPRFGSGSPQRGSSRSSSRRDSTFGQEAPVENFSEPRRLPEERVARDVLGSVTQTLSGSSVSTPSKTALVPYVERQLVPRNNAPGQPEQYDDAQQCRTPNVSGASVGSPAACVLTSTPSEPAANKVRADSKPDKPEISAKVGVEGHVHNSASGPFADVVRGSVEGASAGLATVGGRLQNPIAEEDFDSAPRASAKDSAATFTYGSSETVADLDESSVKRPNIVKKSDKSPAEPQDPSLPGPSCSRVQDAAEKPSESPRELSVKESPSRKNSSPGSAFRSPTAAQGASSPGSPSGNAPDARAPHRSPGESPSKKQSPTASRKSSVSDNPTSKPTTSARGSFPGSPSGGLQDPVEKLLE